MKKSISIFLLLVLSAGAVMAQAIHSLDVEVLLRENGDALVRQMWDVEVNSGTEWFIPIENLGPMDVGDLVVKEGGKTFDSDGDGWNSNRSADKKKWRSGIIRKTDGVELCWGQGELGPHNWQVSFILKGLVQAYEDGDGFNFMFVNPGMIAGVEKMDLVIKPDFGTDSWTEENTRIWGFGYDGEIYLEDGQIHTFSSGKMGKDEKVIVLVRFDKGIFTPHVTRDGTIDDMVDKALEGASFQENEGGSSTVENVLLGIFGIIGLAPVFLFIFFIGRFILGYRYSKSMFGTSRIKGWFRDIPLDGNLFAAYYVLAKGSDVAVPPVSNLIGALFLKWIFNGTVKVVKDAKNPKRVNLVMGDKGLIPEKEERLLYDMVYEASGDNRILESGEFEKYSKKHYKIVASLPNKMLAFGKAFLKEKKYALPGRGKGMTIEGQKEAKHLVELKNFLNDFTLSKDREAQEVGLWNNYLIYAQLFGISEKVTKQFQKLYPEEFSQLASSCGIDPAALASTIRMTNTVPLQAYSRAASSSYSGGGGHTSFGGGGGFSGGGFGGGSR